MIEKISVIVPVYNVEQYIKECIESICRQTYQNLEIIVVDDGSTDNSGRLCDELAAGDSRIQVIHQKNQGVSVARNAGLDRMTGEFVFFVDSDDWLREDALTTLYQSLQTHEADIVIGQKCGFDPMTGCFYYYETSDYEKVYSREEILAEYPKRRRKDGVFISPWGKLYKREVFDKIRYPFGKVAEDNCTTYKTYLKAEKISYLSSPLYYYRLRADGISRIWNEKWFRDLMTGAEEQLAVLAAAGYDISGYVDYYHYLIGYCLDSAASQGLQNTEIYRQLLEKQVLVKRERNNL